MTETLVKLPVLPAPARDRNCTRCGLHEGVKTVCVPTIRFGSAGPAWPSQPQPGRPCILVVGEAPGHVEDVQGRPFVGPSGRKLRENYLEFFGFPEIADIYLSNAARCHPPKNATPTVSQMKACHGFLLDDIHALQSLYDEVVILACGSSAIQAITGGSLRAWTPKQGEYVDFFGFLKPKKPKKLKKGQAPEPEIIRPKPCRVFATYHPAYLMRPNGAQMGDAVHSHLMQLHNHLHGKSVVEIEGELEIKLAPLPPAYSIRRLSFDIETYGFIKKCPPQKHFHPAKMVAYDGIPKDKIVWTVGLTWVSESGQYEHAIFNMQDPSHRRKLWAWFRKVSRDPAFEFLLGHNLTFDLSVMRYCYPECRWWLDHPLPIMDTIITNSLVDEGRPEKSLKNLAPLYNVTRYDAGDGRSYEDGLDPILHQYNCQDTFATLRLHELMEEEIANLYDSRTQKLSPFCYQWYSELLWLIIWMTETGVAMDEAKLSRVSKAYHEKLARLITAGQEKWGLILKGKGSVKSIQSVIAEALEDIKVAGHKPPELRTTDKTEAISHNEENRNALVEVLRNSSSTGLGLSKLEHIDRYQKTSKIINSYIYPLLVGRGKDHKDVSTKLIQGIAYPKWFPVPSEYEDGKTGGTKQSRFACSGPSIPTFPPPIKWCITGHFHPGWLVWSDYSQIELRVAALLSGDPILMQYFVDNVDLHEKTARLIFGDDIVHHPDFKSKYRQAGKTLNFLILFRGSAAKFQQTLLRDIGIYYPLAKCQEAIAAFWNKHRRLIEWQEEIIEFVNQHEYFEIPLIGNSRLFLGGKSIRESSVNEIVNIPIQAVAAIINQSAQFHVWATAKRRRLRASVPINIYDAIGVPCPRTEIYAVRQILLDILPCPPYYQALTAHLGRTLPLKYEIKEKCLV